MMTYIYVHYFSNGDKYVGISNNPDQRWEEGFDSNNAKQYNHKVLIANEKYDRLSLVISENLPRRIAETMEAILINEYDAFNLNIKEEVKPNLHGNELKCISTDNFSHVYPEIDGEILYSSSEIKIINNKKLKPIEVKIRETNKKKEIKKNEEKKKREKIAKNEFKKIKKAQEERGKAIIENWKRIEANQKIKKKKKKKKKCNC